MSDSGSDHLLRIGDFSRFTTLSVRMLRHDDPSARSPGRAVDQAEPRHWANGPKIGPSWYTVSDEAIETHERPAFWLDVVPGR